MSLPRGSLVLVDPEPTLDHGQRGTRPCLVVSDPAVNSSQRFPLLAVVPITGTPAPGAIYPPLAPGANGLTKPSYALVDQLRSIDKQRIRRRYGQVSEAELAAIDEGLRLYLGHEPDPG
jgi:mRNA interferase MazF